jgi:hypothetical protein
LFTLYAFGAVGGVGTFLGLCYLRTGHVKLQVWIAVGVTVAISLLVAWVSCRRALARQASGQSPPVEKQRTWLFRTGVGLLMLWMTFSLFKDFAVALKGHNDRKQTAQVRGDMKSNLRVIRTAAGQADSTGWIPVRSAAGGFSVYVPSPFSEVTTTAEMDGQSVPVVMVGTKTADLKFAALAIELHSGEREIACAEHAIKSLRQFKDAIVCNKRLFKDRFPLMEMEVNVPQVKGFGQAIVTDKTLYILSVESRELTEDVRMTARRFFDSFEIVPSEPNEPTQHGFSTGSTNATSDSGAATGCISTTVKSLESPSAMP